MSKLTWLKHADFLEYYQQFSLSGLIIYRPKFDMPKNRKVSKTIGY